VCKLPMPSGTVRWSKLNGQGKIVTTPRLAENSNEKFERKPLILTVIAVFCLSAYYSPATLADDGDAQKAVLVTGASSGIGLKITEKLSSNGLYVYAGARKAADLERLDAMDNVSSVRLDVTVQEDIDAAVDFVSDQGRGLYGVVNNAGVSAFSPLTSGPESDMDFVFNVNVYGPYRINKAFLPLLEKSGGRTTTIGSIAGFTGRSGIYSMSKFAVEAYTDSWRTRERRRTRWLQVQYRGQPRGTRTCRGGKRRNRANYRTKGTTRRCCRQKRLPKRTR